MNRFVCGNQQRRAWNDQGNFIQSLLFQSVILL